MESSGAAVTPARSSRERIGDLLGRRPAVTAAAVLAVLLLVNFSHGDLLTFGAYMAFLVNVTWDLPFALSVAAAVVATAVLALILEAIIWRPMRAKQAGLFQLMLMSIGLAFLIRATIQ